MNSDELKHCPLCTQDLPVSEFGICRARRDGRNLYCKSCIRAKVTQSRRVLKEYKATRKNREINRYFNIVEPVVPVVTQKPGKRPPVELVREAIQNGAHTQRDIAHDTKLGIDQIGEALASLLLWNHELRTQIVGNERLYFIREEVERETVSYEPAVPLSEYLLILGPRAKGSALSKVREGVKTKAVA